MSWWTRIFLFSRPPFHPSLCSQKEVVVFWQQCQWDQKLQGFLLLQRGSIMLNFSETQLLKRFMPIAMISLLVLAYKKKIAKAYGMTVWIVSTSQMSANFSWVWKHKILENCFIIWCRKMRIKNVQHRSIPSLHLHFIIHHVFYAYDVKRVISSDHSSCIYHLFIHRTINLFMWAMYSAE